MNIIDQNLIAPLYHQLAEILRNKIRSGEFLPGGKIPSERNLMESYRLSRNTVRQAINVLVNEGIVYQDHGRGNFTIGSELNIQYQIDILVEHNEFLRRVGSIPSVQHISTEKIIAPDLVCKALHLFCNEEVVCFTKLFSANSNPAILTFDYLPSKLLGEHFDTSGGGEAFFKLLEEINGKRVNFTVSDIIPINASKDIAKYLGLAPGSSILLLQETFFNPGINIPLAFSFNYYHPNIHFRIVRRRSKFLVGIDPKKTSHSTEEEEHDY